MCACKYKVSGSFHSPPGVLFTFPSQYCSLSVTREYLGLEDGPPLFPPGFTCPAVLWIRLAAFSFRVRDCHSLWLAVPCHSANLPQYRFAVRTPEIFLPPVWPLPRSLATTCGISVDFFSSPYLDVSVQAVPSVRLCVHRTVTGLLQPGFPIRKSTDRCLLSAPRGISLIAASFVGSWCQGIPLVLFVA